MKSAAKKTSYACQACGHRSARWLGRCPACGEWNRFAEEACRELTTQLRETIGELWRYRDLRRYFAAYLIYTDAINTVIVASAIFGNIVLDFTPGDLIIYFLVTQITAGLGSVGFGLSRIGSELSGLSRSR